jgi:hypothetical protein
MKDDTHTYTYDNIYIELIILKMRIMVKNNFNDY